MLENYQQRRGGVGPVRKACADVGPVSVRPSGFRTSMIGVACLSFLLSACETPEVPEYQIGALEPTQASDPSQPCVIPLASGVRLTPLEQCQVERIARRCGEHDPCLVACFANSMHRVRADAGFSEMTIGGGCWHVCFAYRDVEWQEPEGWEDCDGLGWQLPK